MKTCVACNKRQKLSEFHANSKNKSGLDGWCKSCHTDKKLRARYGMSLAQYNAMKKKQRNLCAICKMPETARDSRTNKVKSLSVDHNHACCPGDTSCGECVRGLLCSNCNFILGLVNDNPKVLASASRYLRRYET